tara:strand:+ start:158 stop:364 length:207 start_codon:yes stop_codon:yes gene_type:complete
MSFLSVQNTVIRYKGFLLIQQNNQEWVVRPEKSPIIIFPFKTNPCSVSEVKKMIDIKLSENKVKIKAA